MTGELNGMCILNILLLALFYISVTLIDNNTKVKKHG